jgi:hypothetical protein
VTCIRRAWLALPDGSTVLLEDTTAGYFCTSLDLGSPAVREVMDPVPDGDGADDRTSLMGPRTVTAALSAIAGAGARLDSVASLFGRFTQPSARPVLHYVLDRPGTPERTLTLRPVAYSWPITGPSELDMQLQFVAADPIMRDPVVQTSTGWAGSTTNPGRFYPLTFARTYPPGGMAPSTAVVRSAGDVRVWPLLRVYGPIANCAVNVDQYDGGANLLATQAFRFLASFQVNAGHYVDVDTKAKTVRMDGDPAQSQYANVDWSTSVWPWVDPLPNYGQVRLTGSNAAAATQVQVIWQDGYLT